MVSIARILITGLAAMILAAGPLQAGNDHPAPKLNRISIQRTMSKASDYVDRYAEAAMEQMRKYGIPASVTLAQGILESASGQSELSRKGNNHFGIKATKSWVDNGGRYLVYTDDKPNEKFCQYASVADSYEHHSLFLRGNKRYANLFELSPDDYVGWTRGLQADGYASSQQYASSLQSLIRQHGLDKYDRQVMQEKGWQSTLSPATTTADLAANSKAVLGEQPVTAAPAEEKPAEQQDVAKQEVPKDRDYFNTIVSGEQEGDPWKNFFGLLGEGGGYPVADPIVEIASTLFASLMAMAIQIDNMGNIQQVQQEAPAQQASVSAANTLASQNFENAMNSMNNNPIKRTRS